MSKIDFQKYFVQNDLLNNGFEINIDGRKKLYIDGVLAVKEIANDSIMIKVKNSFITIEGHEMIIEYLCDNEIMVNGVISGVFFS